MKRKRWTEGQKHRVIAQALEGKDLIIINYRWNGEHYAILAMNTQANIFHIRATVHGDICKWEVTGKYEYKGFDKSVSNYHQYMEETDNENV